MSVVTRGSAQLAPSAVRIAHSRIRELAEMAMRMDGVFKLYFGESTLPTPEFIKRAAREALDRGETFYTSNAGLLSLREAIAEYYGRVHGVKLDPNAHIVVTASGVQALNVSIRCMLDPGDEALVLTPAWPNGSSIIEMCNARPRQIAQVFVNGRYGIDFEALERAVTPRTRLLMYTSPSNPLGWVATEKDQEQLLEFARRHGLWLLADEVYERLYYPSDGSQRPAPSILRKVEPQDSVVVAQSFSKAWCMTGWRLGWLVARPDLAQRAVQLNEFIISCANTFVQRAGEAALRHGEAALSEMLAFYRANRDYCLARLQAMPRVRVPQPEGAFYLFPQIEGLSHSFEFCRRLLLETKVGLAPGVAFGAGGEGSVRLSYASDRAVLEPALDRLADFLTRADCLK